MNNRWQSLIRLYSGCNDTLAKGMTASLRVFFLAVATIFGALCILIIAPLKLLPWTEGLAYRGSAWIASKWANGLRWILGTLPTRWNLTGERPDPQGTHLILANHRSWIDILVVIWVLGKNTTLPRFFMKWELIYVPVIGICAWALDFPIMRRYTAEDIKHRPELKHRDFDYAHRVLTRHLDQPCVVVNYAEGTRFSPEKHAKNRSPYTHLLKPKVGGPQLALDCLRNRLDGVYDLTLAYPGAQLSVWRLLSGQIPEIRMHLERIEIPPELQKTPETLVELKAFRGWMNALWAAKDRRLEQMLSDTPANDHRSP